MTDLVLAAIQFQAIQLLLIGATAGLLGGLLGIGGGLVMIPAMLLILGDHFGPDSLHLYKLAAISTSIVLSIPAATRHGRAGAIVYRILPGILPAAAVGVIVGVVGASYFSGGHTHVLKQVFGGFLELVVAFNVYQGWRNARGGAILCESCPIPTRRRLIGAVVGLPSGLLAGLLGIGGGVWAVPSQHLMLGVRLRNAIANSSLMIVVVATITAATQSIAVARMPGLDFVDGWWLALWLAPGALIGGWCGADLTHRLPTRWLRHAFHALLAVTGVRLMFW